MLIAGVGAGWASAPALGQADPAFNRRLEAVAVTPSAVASGLHDIHVIWRATVGPASVPSDLSTIVQVRVNDRVLDLTVGAIADAGAGFCELGPPCVGGCGTGFVDGINAAALLCLVDDPCTPGSCDCDCTFPPITTTIGGQPLEPDDEIVVLLLPAPGAMPDGNPDDDLRTVPFHGGPVMWDRRVLDVELQPVPGAPPTVKQAKVSGTVGWLGQTSPLDLGFAVELKVGGLSLVALPMDGQAIPAKDPLACGGVGCGGLCGFWNGVQVDCAEGFNPFGGCMCGGGWLALFDPQEFGETDPVVEVNLVPLPGALPELPGLRDEGPPGGSCPADLDGDGIVGGGDLGVLLAAWGTSGPGDLDQNGVVDGADLGLMLGSWGVCDPV